jgi:glycosyltransferase involved in cell wall biosynthesis
MSRMLQQSTLVCLPSHGGEGVPKALIEAAASQRAIVATDVPGCRDIVRHGTNGLLVPPKNPAALADAIAQLLDDAPLRAEMGRRGREIAVNEFSEEKVIQQTLALYGKLLSVGAAPMNADSPVREI